MEKENEGVFSRSTVVSNAPLVGKPLTGATAMLDRRGSPSRSFDMPDRDADQPPYSAGNGNNPKLSPAEQARQLPRRVWMIVALALAAWVVVLAVGYLFLG